MAMPVRHRAGHGRDRGGASRQHSHLMPLPPPTRNPAPAPPAPPRLGADHLRGVRPRARRARRRAGPAGRTPSSSRTTAMSAGTAACAATRWVPLPLPEHPARPHPPDRSEIVVPAAGQGAARPDRAAADRDRPDRAFRRAGAARLRGAAVHRPPRDAARRLLPDPHRVAGRGGRRAGADLRARRDPARPGPPVLAALGHPARGRRRAAGLRDPRGRRGGRAVACQAVGRVPHLHLHHRCCCRWRSTRSSTRARS